MDAGESPRFKMKKHNLTYIDLHPAPVRATHATRAMWWVIFTLSGLAIGAMLAY